MSRARRRSFNTSIRASSFVIPPTHFLVDAHRVLLTCPSLRLGAPAHRRACASPRSQQRKELYDASRLRLPRINFAQRNLSSYGSLQPLALHRKLRVLRVFGSGPATLWPRHPPHSRNVPTIHEGRSPQSPWPQSLTLRLSSRTYFGRGNAPACREAIPSPLMLRGQKPRRSSRRSLPCCPRIHA